MVQRLKSGEDIESGKKTITAKAQMPEEFTQLQKPPVTVSQYQSAVHLLC